MTDPREAASRLSEQYTAATPVPADQASALGSTPEPAAGAVELLASQPVAWRVKDFANGWILRHSETEARLQAEGTGNRIEPLYARPQQPTPSPAWREAVEAWVREDLPVGSKLTVGYHAPKLIERLEALGLPSSPWGGGEQENTASVAESAASVASQRDCSTTPSPAGLSGQSHPWQQGKPPAEGLYVGFSDLPERTPDEPTLYQWTGEAWQHWTGWYDGAVTHWIKLDVPAESGEGSPSEASTGNSGLDLKKSPSLPRDPSVLVEAARAVCSEFAQNHPLIVALRAALPQGAQDR